MDISAGFRIVLQQSESMLSLAIKVSFGDQQPPPAVILSPVENAANRQLEEKGEGMIALLGPGTVFLSDLAQTNTSTKVQEPFPSGNQRKSKLLFEQK